jgi:hypothetical protein
VEPIFCKIAKSVFEGGSGATRIFRPMGKLPLRKKNIVGKMGKLFIDGLNIFALYLPHIRSPLWKSRCETCIRSFPNFRKLLETFFKIFISKFRKIQSFKLKSDVIFHFSKQKSRNFSKNR